MPSALKRFRIEQPLRTSQADHQRLTKRVALAVFAFHQRLTEQDGALFFLSFAELRQPGQGEKHDLFAGHGADIVVQADWFCAGDLLN
jgi:hypothetical protein